VCWSEAAVALLAAGARDAERRPRAALPVLEAGYGPDHALVANAYIGLGDARLAQGDAGRGALLRGGARADGRSSIDDAYLASAEYGAGDGASFRREPARARRAELMSRRIARWRDDPGVDRRSWPRPRRGWRERAGAADDPSRSVACGCRRSAARDDVARRGGAGRPRSITA
jgi:hypothetical protein